MCKITEVHYTNTVFETEEFYVKLDNLLPDLFEPFDLTPQFSFGLKLKAQEYAQNNQEKVNPLTTSQTKMMRDRLYGSDIDALVEENEVEMEEEEEENEVEVLEYQPSEMNTSQFGTKVNSSAAIDL